MNTDLSDTVDYEAVETIRAALAQAPKHHLRSGNILLSLAPDWGANPGAIYVVMIRHRQPQSGGPAFEYGDYCGVMLDGRFQARDRAGHDSLPALREALSRGEWDQLPHFDFGD